MDKFEDIQAFIAVVDTGSFTAAADRLGSAKSAVSRRVSALERRLGVQLLHRTTRVLNLTETGRSFYNHGTRILADLAEAEAAVQQEHGELRGTLRFALPLSFGVRHMCGPIATFSKLHPKVRFDLDLNDRRVDLIEDNFDVALRIGRLADSSLIARRLFDVRAVVCGSPHYLNVHGVPKTPADLADHQCLVYSNLIDPDKWVYEDSDGNKSVVKVNSTLSASSGDFLCNAAGHGIGLVIQPTFIASAAIRSGNLTPVLTDYTWPISPAYAMYPPTRHLSYRVRAFIDFLAEKFAGTPQWDRDCETLSAKQS
jgi:DNA-binding transcriptional LysR family regulator